MAVLYRNLSASACNDEYFSLSQPNAQFGKSMTKRVRQGWIGGGQMMSEDLSNSKVVL